MRTELGASLIEVLVAMVLLALGLLGTVAFSSVGRRALSYGEQIGRVSALAQATMENELGRSYADLISEGIDNHVVRDGIQLT